jgi:DNA-binding beta-propeller fold protein YncE
VQFNDPVGVAIDKGTSNVYVVDRLNDRLVVLNGSGGLVKVLGKAGAGAGDLEEPVGVAIDANGNVWVVDNGNSRIDEFKHNGEFVQAMGWGVSNGEAKLETCTTTCRAGLSGPGAGELSGPTWIAISGGDLYVSDSSNARVEEYGEKHEYLRTIGARGSGNGQFGYPAGLAVNAAGDLYVVDSADGRVDEFNPTGALLTTFGTQGSGAEQFFEPEGLALNSAGTIYAVDSSNDRVQEWE